MMMMMTMMISCQAGYNKDDDFYPYRAEIPIEEIPSSMAVPNGHWESI